MRGSGFCAAQHCSKQQTAPTKKEERQSRPNIGARKFRCLLGPRPGIGLTSTLTLKAAEWLILSLTLVPATKIHKHEPREFNSERVAYRHQFVSLT